MTTSINDDLIELKIDDNIIASAAQPPDGWWKVTNWPNFLDRNQAITSLTVTELLASGFPADDPLVSALREELR